jgi:SSS family solute:Na+ symporter
MDSGNTVVYLMFGAYALLTLVISVYGFKREKNTPEDYFLASRTVGPFVLFFTIVATNFSAFFFLGFAGAGYRIGYSYYGMMAFGTAFVAVAFYLVGHRAWRLGRANNYITPPELIGKSLDSKLLEMVYLAVMVIFTLPYLALQPIGAGYIVSNLTDGEIPYFHAASLITAFIVLYVYLGGMRTVAWTDVLQGVMMLSLITAAVVMIASGFGGFADANARALQQEPGLFSPKGLNDYYSPQSWFSYTLLWCLSVPMFPHIFMRFFIPRTSSSLQTTIVIYPVVTAILFLFPVTIGVLGHVPFPGLEGKEADQILPMMLGAYTPFWFEALVMVGALAAFMSTMDSQLLALSSILTRDVYQRTFMPSAGLGSQVLVGRLLVAALAVIGLAFAYQPPATILEIATEAFTGLSVLFPTTIATLYWSGTRPMACLVSIVVGEALLAGFATGTIPDSLAFGFLPVVPILLVTSAIVVLGSVAHAGGRIHQRSSDKNQ